MYKSNYRNKQFNINNIQINFSNDELMQKSKVEIICICNNLRLVDYSAALAIIHNKNSGLCVKCSNINQSKNRIGIFKNLEDKILSSGSIIHWSQRDPKLGPDQKVPVTCISCNRIRIVCVQRKKDWDGICYKCKAPKDSKSHPMWSGGKTLSKEGYIYVHISLLDSNEQDLFKPMLTKYNYILEHRIVMARSLNRPLLKHEKVHHINEIKDDNRLENLELTDDSKHLKHHFAKTKDLNARIEYLESLLKSNDIPFDPMI